MIYRSCVVPKLLVERFTDDSISQFRISGSIRYKDAWELYYSGRLTAAIYLWGYAVEMALKVAWFSNVLQYDDARIIQRSDLNQARDLAKNTYGLPWQGGLHNLESWANLINQHRISIGNYYSDVNFGNQALLQSRIVYSRWRETLRYKKNRAYIFEADSVAEATEWFLLNSSIL
jgi:hypothetical protein